MTDSGNDAARKSADALLKHYSFDQGDLTSDQILDSWLRNYPARWVRLALVEALYQGRYKAVSVEQILARWVRRGQPKHQFNDDFEHLVCNNLPKTLLESTELETQETVQNQDINRSGFSVPISSELPPWQAPGTNVVTPLGPILDMPLDHNENLVQAFQAPEASDFFVKLTKIARTWNRSRIEQIFPGDRI